MNQHWTEDDFLQELYGIGPGDGHLNECSECRGQFDRIVATRRELLSSPSEVPAIKPQRESRQRKWIPVAAMAGVLTAFVIWRTPVAPPPPDSQLDSKVMAEIVLTAFDSEPNALAPLHGLFQSHQPKEIKRR